MAVNRQALLDSTGITRQQATHRTERRARNVLPALLLAVLIIVGAWLLGGRQGFEAIGTGGDNLQLLPKVGDVAPDIEVLSLTDLRTVKLSEYRGQPVWINFWGSWCPPCRSEFPELEAAYVETLAPNGVALLAIALDEPSEATARYASRNGGTFTILSDPNRRATGSFYPIANFPTHILIDSDGIIRDIILSPMDQETIELAAQQIISPEIAP